jgi:hypothetical protein
VKAWNGLEWAAHGGAERGRSWERGATRDVGCGLRNGKEKRENRM